MNIKGLQKLTLLDFPGLIACTIFTEGCNMRCPFCQNKNLVLPECSESIQIPEQDVLEFLTKRKDKLQGVCITGGEPTLQSDLYEFIGKIKNIGYKVKLDTNGTNPECLKTLIDMHLLDYIAMDIKNSPHDYPKTIGCENINIKNIYRSINLIKGSGIKYEFRTTVVHELHNAENIWRIKEMLGEIDTYSLQYYVSSDNVINPVFSTPTDTEMQMYKDIMSKTVKHVYIKGV